MYRLELGTKAQTPKVENQLRVLGHKPILASTHEESRAKESLYLDFIIGRNASTISSKLFLEKYEELGGSVAAFRLMSEVLATLIDETPAWKDLLKNHLKNFNPRSTFH